MFNNKNNHNNKNISRFYNLRNFFSFRFFAILFITIVCSFAARSLIIYLLNLDLSHFSDFLLKIFVGIITILSFFIILCDILYLLFSRKVLLCEGTGNGSVEGSPQGVGRGGGRGDRGGRGSRGSRAGSELPLDSTYLRPVAYNPAETSVRNNSAETCARPTRVSSSSITSKATTTYP